MPCIFLHLKVRNLDSNSYLDYLIDLYLENIRMFNIKVFDVSLALTILSIFNHTQKSTQEKLPAGLINSFFNFNFAEVILCSVVEATLTIDDENMYIILEIACLKPSSMNTKIYFSCDVPRKHKDIQSRDGEKINLFYMYSPSAITFCIVFYYTD